MSRQQTSRDESPLSARVTSRAAWLPLAIVLGFAAPALAGIVKPAPAPAPTSTPPVSAPVSVPAIDPASEVFDRSLLATPAQAVRDNIRWPVAASPPADSPAGPSELATEGAAGSNFRWRGLPEAPLMGSATQETAQDAASAPRASASPDRPADALRLGLAAYGRAGDPRRYDEAARNLRVAADAGDQRASAALGYLQGRGLGVPRDPRAARARLRSASEAGIARADYLLSLIEHDDRRPGASQREAALRESAAERGDPVAQNAMGVHYQLQGDRTTAQMWYRRAAEAGSPGARANLAGLAVKASDERDARTTGEAGAAGEAQVLFARAQRYHRGDGAPPDYAQALRYYRAAAAHGSSAARQMLGLIQSRPGANGAVDAAWMRQLAAAPVGNAGISGVTRISQTSASQPRNDDPLAGLAALPVGTRRASPPNAAPAARRIP